VWQEYQPPSPIRQWGKTTEENATTRRNRGKLDTIAFAGVLLALSGFLIWFIATLSR
jgi:hypothetical protein